MSYWLARHKKPIIVTGLLGLVFLSGLLLTNRISRESAPSAQTNHIPALNQAQFQHIKDRCKNPDGSDNPQGFITGYISAFLRQGYAKYYNITGLVFRFDSYIINDEKVEAVVLTTMKCRPKNPASDPDTVPYIKAAREKAEQESDPQIKKIDQDMYEAMKKEYGKEMAPNYFFKFTANMADGEIDESSIKLYIVQDAAPNHTEYLPAEEILPK